jgi:2',3'-cyclic-nucleotide 2'-phosphodiesterase (5'-nucleotidase family)
VSESTKESEMITEFIEPYKDDLAEKMDIEIAVSEVNFEVRRPSSNLMNWMADAVFTHQTKNKRLQEPIFCMLNTGGIRSSLGIGRVTIGDIFKIMPFENTIVWVKLPIKELKSIEAYLSKTGGEPISNIEVLNGRIHFNTLDLKGASHFWVITSDYLNYGGDQMDFFEQRTEIIETNILIRDALIEEAKIQEILINNTQKRIR